MPDHRLVGAGQLKIGADRPGAAPEQPEHDNSQSVLERAMSSSFNEPTTHDVQNRSNEGSQGTTIHGDGTVETWHDGVMTGSSANIRTGVDVFKSIVSANGDQRISIHEADMDSRITLANGMEMTIKSALDAGFVKEQDGTFVAGDVDSSAEVKDQDLDPSDAGEFLPEADEATFKDIIDNTSAQDQVSIINDITTGDGQIDMNTINRAASEAGIEPAAMAGKVNSVAVAMRDQASRAVAKHGVDAEAVWEYANQPENVGTLQAAVRKHAMTRSTAAYGDIAKSYILAMDEHSPDAILSADLGDGIKRTYRDHNGTIVIEDASGRGYSWKSAVRSGLVRLS